MSIIPVFISLAAIFLALFGVWLGRQLRQLRAELPELIQNQMRGSVLDLLERTTRLTTELRDGMNQQLSRNFLESQERIERALGANRQEMQSGLLKTTQALETRFQSLELQVSTRLETIGRGVEARLSENLKEGFRHFEKVQQHLQAAEQKLASLNAIGQSISDLNQLLKLPHLRGGFGEATLERLLADFLPAGSFELQFQISPGSTERVDAVVRLARQLLPIDSKFPREQVLPLFDSSEPGALETARRALSDFTREQARQIAEKYIRPDQGTTEMALLFLPSETLYFEVIRNGKLFEQLARLKVFPVSPNTLAISLQSIAIAREYYEMARGVERTIEDVRKARRHFEHFERKFEDVGKGLKKAQEAYETAHTHLGRYESSVYRLMGDADELGGLVEGGSSSQPEPLPPEG